MTEVPDKQTEGTGAGRGRGRGRGAASRREAEPVAARGGRRTSEPAVAVTSSGAPLVVLPGEKLSKVMPLDGGPETDEEESVEPVEVISPAAALPRDVGPEAEAGRRRRRRGGRGRGRGRQRGEGGEAPIGADQAGPADIEEDRDELVEAPRLPRAPRATPFGSVWDSQLGVSSPTTTPIAPRPEDDDLDEPEIPEYLIAERNRGRSAPGVGGPRGRGNRAAYAAAMDRERYGRGGGGGGINRYPDVSRREPPRDAGFPRRDRPVRQDRPERHDRPAPRPGGGDPWSEVPPELEAMLRAQVLSRPRPEPPVVRRDQISPDEAQSNEPRGEEPRVEASVTETETPKRAPRSRRPAATVAAPGEAPIETGTTSPAKRTTTRRTTRTAADKTAGTKAATPKPRTTRATAASERSEPKATKPRATRRRTSAAGASPDASSPEAAPDASSESPLS